MTDLPEPLTTPEMIIIELDSFMLNTEMLLRSELWAISTGDEFKAAMGLWCRAWKQTPAGSLPDDERVLCGFSGAGAKWKKIRDVALRGFVKCSDGRLYHRVLCDDVRRAWTKKQSNKQRASRGAAARWGSSGDASSIDEALDEQSSSNAQAIRNHAHRQGQGQGQKSTPPPPSAPTKPPAAGGGAKSRISALNPEQIVDTVRSGDLWAVLSAFRVNTDPSRRDDWLREADLLDTHTLAMILYRAYIQRSPVREPSGLRQWRKDWDGLPPATRADVSAGMRKYLQPALDRDQTAKKSTPAAPGCPRIDDRAQGVA